MSEFTDLPTPPRSIRFWVNGPYAGTEQTVCYAPPDNWATMTPAERETWCMDVLDTEVSNYLDSGFAASDDEPED